MRKNIANCFTLLNLVFGFLAVVYILRGFPGADAGNIFPRGEIYWASVFICFAAVVDFLDGLIARLFNASSMLGKELDSLADLVSFGVAPGLIVYQFLKISFEKMHPELQLSMWYLLPVVLLPCAGAYRLARFNLSTSSTLNFQGLPIPAAGILIASFPVIFISNTHVAVNDLLTNNIFWYVIAAIVSFLMVSSLPMISMKFKNLSWQKNWYKFMMVIFAVVAAVALHWLAVPVLFVIYVLLSLLVLKRER